MSKLTKFQEYKVQTEHLEDGTIKIVKKEKTDLVVSIYPHEADIMNNGASDAAVEFGAASRTGKLYLPVKEKKEPEGDYNPMDYVGLPRGEVLMAMKNEVKL